jgi:hypothetical protein
VPDGLAPRVIHDRIPERPHQQQHGRAHPETEAVGQRVLHQGGHLMSHTSQERRGSVPS